MRRAGIIGLLVLAACATPPAPQPAPETAPAPPTEEKVVGTVRVNASTLNVRQEPKSNATVLKQVKRGDQLSLLATDGGWSRVKLASGEVGWVFSQYLSSGKPRPRKGCPPDSEFGFVKAPLAAFSEGGPHGLVVVDATVNTSGDVLSTRVITNTTGEDALGKMAEREIRAAKFIPPYRDCVPKTFIFTYKRTY
ncbi:MAG TPA: SH3 domain-containing protein [Thermoanaerobaculia bacterium]|nr:SH3 domain-containing protein [Thermoanaerobaculia bacterium]